MTRRSAHAYAMQRFVDALRECLGLAPMYDNRPRPEVERFNVRTHGTHGWSDGARWKRTNSERRSW